MPGSSTPGERRLAGQAAVLKRWARTADRSAATAPARTAFERRFWPTDPNLSPEQAAKMADAARRAHFAELARRAAKARRLAREEREAEVQLRRAQRADQVGGAA